MKGKGKQDNGRVKASCIYLILEVQTDRKAWKGRAWKQSPIIEFFEVGKDTGESGCCRERVGHRRTFFKTTFEVASGPGTVG